MQIMIDSAQPLDDVLRVVGAMYNVNLTVDGAEAQTPNGTRRTRRTRADAPKPRGRRSRNSQKPATAGRRGRRSVSTAEIRQWAVDRGYEVASKGRIPASIVDAYRSSSA